MSKFTKDYQNFFLKSEAGKHFMDFVNSRLQDCVDRASKNPDEARDLMQKYNGLAEVKDHIGLVGMERGSKK